MGNWTLGCMTHLSCRWVSEDLGPRNSGSQARWLPGREWSEKLNCIHCWVTLRCLQAPEWKFLSCCPSSLVLILSAYLPPRSRRKAIFRALSSGFQAQWESPSCSDPRRQLYRWWLTHSQLRSPELPLLIHTRQTLGWLGIMNLHSQQGAFSSQPSSNLDMCLMFPQGTTGWTRSGLRLAWMQGMCSLFDAPNRPWRFCNRPYIL